MCIQIAKITKTRVGTVWNGAIWSCSVLIRKESSFVSLFHDISFLVCLSSLESIGIWDKDTVFVSACHHIKT